jgi:hypothetical protein
LRRGALKRGFNVLRAYGGADAIDMAINMKLVVRPLEGKGYSVF